MCSTTNDAQTDSDTIYHYTDQRGLLGILKSRTLWATSVRHLNDTSEVRGLLEILGEVRRERGGLTGLFSLSEAALRSQIISDQIRSSPSDHIASFSAEGDLLSQWRAYTPCAGGFALGFWRKGIASIKFKNAALGPCSYDRAGQKMAFTALLDQLDDLTGVPSDFIDPIVRDLAPLFKHPKFAEEKEWRLVLKVERDDADLRFRPGRSFLVPYVEVPLPTDDPPCLTEVIIGPCPYPREARSSVESLLSVQKFPNVNVLSSKIPFRNW